MDTKELRKDSPIAVYLRKSRFDGTNPEDTLVKHRAEIQRHIELQGYTNVIWYEEIVSGESIEGRPEMLRLLSDIDDGHFSAVIAVHIDRLSRGTMSDNDKIIEAFKRANCILITTSNNRTYDFRDMSRAFTTEVEMLFARQELRTIKERLWSGKLRTFEKGKIFSGAPPFGYFVDYNTNEYLIDREKADLYLWIVDRYLSGHSTNTISLELNRNKFPPPSGKSSASWSHNTVGSILKNPFYAGFITMGKSKSYRDGDNKLKRKRESDPSKWELRNGTHEALISEETHQRIMDMLAQNSKRTASARRATFRLSGLLRCEACGHSVSIRNTGIIRKCKYPLRDGTTCEANRGINEQIIVDVLRNNMKAFHDELFDVTNLNSGDIESRPSLNVNPIEIQRSIVMEANAKIGRAKLLYLEGDLLKAEYDSIKETETTRIDEATKELERISVAPEAKKEEQRKIWTTVDLETLFLEQLTPAEFNREAKKLIESISYLYDGSDSLNVDIKYR